MAFHQTTRHTKTQAMTIKRKKRHKIHGKAEDTVDCYKSYFNIAMALQVEGFTPALALIPMCWYMIKRNLQYKAIKQYHVFYLSTKQYLIIMPCLLALSIHVCSLYICASQQQQLSFSKAIADGLVGQVLARPLFLKVKMKFHFTKSK